MKKKKSKKSMVMSIFVFNKIHKDLPSNFLNEYFGFSDYMEEFCEMGGSPEWEILPIEEVFNLMSYSEYWSDSAVEIAKSKGITKCRRAFLILRSEYTPSLQKDDLPEDPIFLGVFKFKY